LSRWENGNPGLKQTSRSFFMGSSLSGFCIIPVPTKFEQFSADSKKSETPVPIENLGWEWDINGPDAPQ
jgi:hypothetical protein